jgi:hypothetical protein
MRSDLVFAASGHVKNRYLLCHLVRNSSRKFHKPGVPMQKTISKVFGLVTDQAFSTMSVETKKAWQSSFSSVPLAACESVLQSQSEQQTQIERAG